MSKTIDERVVEMRFDNKQFESATATSMSTIDKLKAKLNFTGATKGLESISGAAKKVDMSGLGTAVETVHSKFSALEVMGVTALANITNSAVNAGKNLISAFTIDPITSGFKEYETQMNAIQTILANTQSKGTTLDDVTAALDELNTYADQTIYNFTEMTRNIGTFTAAGVGLEESVSAIKGIANLAAVSGSNSQQAATAMYQLSQALAAGRVSLMDWNSVVNAGMGGELFQNALIRTAQVMETGVDAALEKYGTFRESLTKGQWLTAEVLTETLAQISGAYTEAELIEQGYTEQQAKDIMQLAQTATDAATKVKTFTQLMDTLKEAAGSGWAKTWQIVLGDFEEAKEFFTGLSDYFSEMINASSDARNSLLEGAFDSNWSKLTKEIEAAGVPLETFGENLKKVAKEHNIDLDAMIEKQGSLAKVMESGAISGDIVVETIKRIAGTSTELNSSTAAMTDKLEYFQKVVNEVWNGDFKNGEERVKALTEAGYDYAEVQRLVNATVDGHRLTLEDLSDTELKAIGYTEDQIKALKELAKQAEESGTSVNELINNLDKPSGRVLFLETISNALKALFEPLRAIKQAFNEVFAINSVQVYGIIEALHRFSEAILMDEESLKKLTSTFKGIFGVIKIFTSLISGGVGIAFNVLTGILEKFDIGLLDVTANIGEVLYAFSEFITSGEIISTVIDGITSLFSGASGPLSDFIDGLKEIPIVSKVLDGISSFLTKLQNGFRSFTEIVKNEGPAEAIKQAFDEIQNYFSNFTWDGFIESLRSFGENVRTMFSDIGAYIETNAPKLMEKIGDGFSSGVNKVLTKIKEIGNKIVEAFKALFGIEETAPEMEEAGESVFQGYIDGLSSGANKVFDTIKSVMTGAVETIQTAAGNVNWGKIAAIAISGGLLVTVKKLVDAVAAIAAPLEGVGDILSGVGEVIEKAAKPIAKTIKSFSGLINAKAFSIRADAIKSIATALAILAGSLFLLSKVDSAKLWESVGAIAALSVVLGGLSAVIGHFGAAKFGSMGGIALVAVSLAASLSIVASALKKLESLDPNKMNQTLGAFTVVVLAMGALIAVCGGVATASNDAVIAKLGTTMLALSAALLLMVAAIKLMSGMDAGDLVKGGAAISAFVGIMYLIAQITTIGNEKAMAELGGMMIKLSAALIIMVVAVKLISGLDADEIIKGGLGITAFLGVITILTKITNTAKPVAANLGTTMLALSASMLIMTGVIALISGISTENLLKGIAALSLFSAVIAILVQIMNMADKEVPKMSGTLLAMSAAIAILAGVAIVLSLIDLEGLAKGITAVTILSAIMAGLIVAARYAHDSKGTITAISIAIGVMAAAVVALSFIDPADLTGATLALTVLMGMFALVVKSASNVTTSMGVMISMSAAIGVLGGVIYLLASLPIESVLGSAAALSTLLISLAASMKLMSGLQTVSTKSYVALGVMTLVLGALAGILYLLQDLPVESTLPVVASLSALLAALLGATAVLGALGKFVGAGAILQGLAGFAAVVAGVGALMVAIGALQTYFPQLEGFLDTGMGLLEKIGYGLGSFFGNIIGGFTAGVTSGLPEIGENLSTFMESAQPFFDGVKDIDSSSMSGVQALADTILTLTKANILDSIGKFLGGETSLAKFGEEIVPFGTAMKKFGEELGEFDGDTVESAANAGKALAEMADTIPNSGGVAAFFAGENDMGVFSEQIVAFGSAMKEYGEVISGIDAEIITNSATAGKALAEMAATIPNSGGLLGFLAGENDMDQFAEKIVPFGEAMKEYGDAVTGLKSDVITNSTTAGKALIELADTIPNSGGLWGFIAGDNDMGAFAAKIVPFGKAMTDYSVAVKGLDSDAVTNSTTAGEALIKLAETIPNSGGLFAFFSGDNDMATFGTQLVSFGKSMAEYSESVKDVDPNIVTATANAADSLVTLSEKIPENRLFKNETTLDEFGKQLSEFGSYFKEYYDSVSGIDAGTLTPVVDAVGKLVDMAGDMAGIDIDAVGSFGKALAKLGNAGIDSFIEAFQDADSRIRDAATEMLNSFINGAESMRTDMSSTFIDLMNDAVNSIDNKSSEFNSAGSECMKNFINGINGQNSNSTSAFNNIITSCLNSITSKNSSFNTAGQNLMTNFISGIKNRETSLKSTFTDIIESILSAIRNTNSEFRSAGEELLNRFDDGISSGEYRVRQTFSSILNMAASSIRNEYYSFYDAGGYLARGFGDGIDSYMWYVQDQARSMANAAYNAAMRELQSDSPSKLFKKVGSYVPLGFARGIESGESNVESSIAVMTKSAVDNTTKAISKIVDAFDSDVDTQPRIRPVLDLSNLEQGTKQINSMFSNNQAMSISARFSRNANSQLQNGANEEKKTVVNQFTQNNYSPKALSRVEIYRQTSNQFSTFERMTET